MDQRKKKILKGIEQFGFIKLDADNGFCYGYLNKQDWLNALKELKEEGCINYSDIKEGIFKGEPNSKITITNYGKNLINE